MREYCDGEETYIEMFVHLHGFSPHKYEKVGFVIPIPICGCMYVYVLLTPERLDGLNLYSGFKSLSVIGHIPAPKLRTLQMGSKTQNGDFLENVPNDFG
jgi:hypothetical protein